MRNTKFLIIVGLNVIVLLLALWLKPRYQTNDDIGMIYAYSGTGIFDQPTTLTVFSTKVWGVLMVSLYKALPLGIEAYTIVFFALIFISNVVIQRKIFENQNYKSVLFWILYIPILGFIVINYYLELQFTMVAGFLCFTSVLLLLDRPGRREKVYGYLLFCVGILIRPDVIPIVLGFLFLLYYIKSYILFDVNLSRQKILKQFSLLILIFFSVYFLDKSLFTENEKHFHDFSRFRAGIVDYNSDQSNPSLLPPNWDKEELFLFKNWFFSDTILYNNSKNYRKSNRVQNNNFIGKINFKTFRFRLDLVQFWDPLFRCILILTLIPLFFINEWKRCLINLLLLLVIYLLFYNFLTLFFKVPPFRVSFMLFSSCMLLHLYYVSKMVKSKSLNIIPTFCAVFFVIYGLWITRISLETRKSDILNTRCVETYNPSVMYFRWMDYPFELVDPFKVSIPLHKNKIVSMGAFSVHPAINKNFGNFRYNNLTKDIIGKDSIVSFMMPMDTSIWHNFNFAYCAFIQKRYKREVFFRRTENVKHCYGYAEFKLMEKTDAKLD